MNKRIAGLVLSGLFAQGGLRRGIATGDVGPIIIGAANLVCFVWCGVTLPSATRLRRARKLLLAHLNDEQREEFEDTRSFRVRGSDGRLYRIHQRWAYAVSSGGYKYCAYPEGVPIYDSMLAQKLLIETDTPEFIANAFYRAK